MSNGFIYYREEFYKDYEAARELEGAKGGRLYSHEEKNWMPSKQEAFTYYEYFAMNSTPVQYFGRVVKPKLEKGFGHQEYGKYEPRGQAFNPGSASDAGGKEFNGMRFHDDQFKYAWLKKHRWTAILNDIWLIANTHVKKQFKPVSPIEYKYVMASKPYYVSVFGRELCGLLMSGYTRNDKGIFMSTNGAGSHKETRLSLCDYAKKIDEMQKGGEIAFKEFFARGMISVK